MCGSNDNSGNIVKSSIEADAETEETGKPSAISKKAAQSIGRRAVLKGGLVAGALGTAGCAVGVGAAVGAGAETGQPAHGHMAVSTAAAGPYADPAEPFLPGSDMRFDFGRTALVVTDPQIDFLHPDGVAWGVVGASVEEHNTVENIGRLFEAAKSAGITVAISPHYYFATDHNWQFAGALEKLMHNIRMFDRPTAYDLTGFEGSGADFMPEYRQYIFDGQTVICSPHKVYGPEQNDLVLQLRKRRIDQVILAGMSANLCTESHMRALLEQGFEVAVVRDATAAAQLPEGDGYLAALTNFRFMANAVVTTDQAVGLLRRS